MENLRQAQNNMYGELFIEPDQNGGTFSIPYTCRRECRRMMASKWGPEIQMKGFLMLIDWCRVDTAHNRGKFSADACDHLIGMILDFARKNPQPGFEAGEMLGEQGDESEKFGDYESALKFYRASLRFPNDDVTSRYFQLNNLGFCLNFFCKFDEAEEYLRAAVVLCPWLYNAWKNLGVTLEHQGKYEEAAEYYMKAIELSRAEPRSVGHLRRLVVRQPVLAEKYPDIPEEDNLP